SFAEPLDREDGLRIAGVGGVVAGLQKDLGRILAVPEVVWRVVAHEGLRRGFPCFGTIYSPVQAVESRLNSVPFRVRGLGVEREREVRRLRVVDARWPRPRGTAGDDDEHHN